MSEMALGSDEHPNTLADAINAALVGLAGCVGSALDDICTYSVTFGEAYVPFQPDEGEECDEDTEEDCNQAWVRVTDVNVVMDDKGWDTTPGGDDGSCEGACGGTFQIGVEIGVLRCYPIPEKGEAPTATDVMSYSMQSMIDMTAIYQAAMNCDDAGIEHIVVGQWQPEGPLGGQYGGFWNFTIEV